MPEVQVRTFNLLYECHIADQNNSTVAAAVYTTVQTHTVTKYTDKLVPLAAIAAGLPASDVAALMAVVGTPALTTSYSPAIVAAVGGAVQQANVHGVQLVALTSLGFGMVGLIACLFCKDVNSKMNSTIEAFIAGEEEKAHLKTGGGMGGVKQPGQA